MYGLSPFKKLNYFNILTVQYLITWSLCVVCRIFTFSILILQGQIYFYGVTGVNNGPFNECWFLIYIHQQINLLHRFTHKLYFYTTAIFKITIRIFVYFSSIHSCLIKHTRLFKPLRTTQSTLVRVYILYKRLFWPH